MIENSRGGYPTSSVGPHTGTHAYIAQYMSILKKKKTLSLNNRHFFNALQNHNDDTLHTVQLWGCLYLYPAPVGGSLSDDDRARHWPTSVTEFLKSHIIANIPLVTQ